VSKPIGLVQGALDLLILKIIALEPAHGWAIVHRIRQVSGDVLQMGQSALCPALHKLEQNVWISSEWAVGDNNRRATFSRWDDGATHYFLMKAGRKARAEESAGWERLAAGITTIGRAV
jgi:PadR family transcriptional regulator